MSSALSVACNPVAVTGYVSSVKDYLVMVFVQTTDGQVSTGGNYKKSLINMAFVVTCVNALF